MKRFFFYIFILLIPLSGHAVTELDFNFGFNKSIFGKDRENKSISKMYSAGIAFYFFNLTAIEFTYGIRKDGTDIVYEVSDVSSGVYIQKASQILNVETIGVGIRQALASRRAFLLPVFSFGWSRQEFTEYTNFTTIDKATDISNQYQTKINKTKYSSLFTSFSLKIKLTRGFSIKGSVKTIFKAFEWNEAKDRLRYSLGFSWMF